MNKNADLYKKMSQLEFINDQLEAEMEYINRLLQSVGFSEGIDSVKAIAKELIEDEGFAAIKPKKIRKQTKNK